MSTGSLFVNFEARCWAEQARDLLYLAVAVRAGLGVASGRCEEAPDEREKKEAKQKKKRETTTSTIDRACLLLGKELALFSLLHALTLRLAWRQRRERERALLAERVAHGR